MKNLLIPFDFSDVSINALEYVIKFAAGSPKTSINLLYISKSKMEVEEEKKLKNNFEQILKKYQGAGEPPISYHFTPEISPIQ